MLYTGPDTYPFARTFCSTSLHQSICLLAGPSDFLPPTSMYAELPLSYPAEALPSASVLPNENLVIRSSASPQKQTPKAVASNLRHLAESAWHCVLPRGPIAILLLPLDPLRLRQRVTDVLPVLAPSKSHPNLPPSSYCDANNDISVYASNMSLPR